MFTLFYCPICKVWTDSRKEMQSVCNDSRNDNEILNDMFANDVETLDLTTEEIQEILESKPEPSPGWKRKQENNIWIYEKVDPPTIQVTNLRWDYDSEQWSWDSNIYPTYK